MSVKRYVRELEECVEADAIDSFKRAEPVKAKDVKHMSPVSILEKHILSWPPRDVRFEQSYLKNHSFEFLDSEFMTDIADGMELRVIERLPKENSVVFGVYLQSNLAEFERYNLVVEEHNNRWAEQGCPEDVFNPITGDISRIRDTLVREAEADSPYRRSPAFMFSDGPLQNARPEIKRDLYIKIKYRLEKEDGVFKMEFVAWDAKDLVIFYDTIEDTNMAYLARRATQELFGNPFVYGESGALLDGIGYLIQGKKLDICHANNTIPEWPELKDAKCKSSNPALVLSNANQIFYRILGIAFGYFVPVYVAWTYIVVKSYNSLIAVGNGQFGKYGEKGDPSWMPTVIGACVVLLISFLIAKYCYRKTNVERLTSKLL